MSGGKYRGVMECMNRKDAGLVGHFDLICVDASYLRIDGEPFVVGVQIA